VISVDTSVWLAFFEGRSEAAPLVKLLEENVVVVHPVVATELGLGRGLSEERRADVERLVVRSPRTHDEVVAVAQQLGLRGAEMGYVDLHVLCSAVKDRDLVWSLERSVTTSAERIGVACRLPSSR
jgi:hypothetical protein